MEAADIKALLKECSDMQAWLEEVPSDEPKEMTDRLSVLGVYMARSGNMLADAKYLQDKARSMVFVEHGKSILKMPATVSTKFIDSQVGEVNYLVNWLDRINRTCVHQSDSMRTLLSFMKEQLRLNNTGY